MRTLWPSLLNMIPCIRPAREPPIYRTRCQRTSWPSELQETTTITFKALALAKGKVSVGEPIFAKLCFRSRDTGSTERHQEQLQIRMSGALWSAILTSRRATYMGGVIASGRLVCPCHRHEAASEVKMVGVWALKWSTPISHMIRGSNKGRLPTERCSER